MRYRFRHKDIWFADIPLYFVERYWPRIEYWGENIRQEGLVEGFLLEEGYLADLSPNAEFGAQLIEVKLKCRPYHGMVEISPLEERDDALIQRHCEKLQRAGLPSNAFLREPARLGVPFMPKVVQ